MSKPGTRIQSSRETVIYPLTAFHSSQAHKDRKFATFPLHVVPYVQQMTAKFTCAAVHDLSNGPSRTSARSQPSCFVRRIASGRAAGQSARDSLANSDRRWPEPTEAS